MYNKYQGGNQMTNNGEKTMTHKKTLEGGIGNVW